MVDSRKQSGLPSDAGWRHRASVASGTTIININCIIYSTDPMNLSRSFPTPSPIIRGWEGVGASRFLLGAGNTGNSALAVGTKYAQNTSLPVLVLACVPSA
ncbi:hypothetical protein J6590_021127 [Homalodisca vitripennis]|nr:hypothetical protein J6590_021127 [Homalodisca vitripennis]